MLLRLIRPRVLAAPRPLHMAVRFAHSEKPAPAGASPAAGSTREALHSVVHEGVAISTPPEPAAIEGPSSRPTLPERFVSALPLRWQPYARVSRMDKPIGTWLLWSPCTWSLTMAATMQMVPVSQTAYMLGVFLVGAWLTRGFGCTINDIWDRDLDRGVHRTKSRPIAANEISVKQATGWLAAQGFASLGVLATLPKETWLVGAASIVPVIVYPLFKRFTYYPQLWLSLWFSWGTVMGFPALGASLADPQVLTTSALLLTSASTWSVIYDTVYGHQDKADDIKVGVKSTALKWGERTKPILYRLWGLQAASLLGAGAVAGMGPGFYTGSLIALTNLLRMLRSVDLDNPASSGKFFKTNLRNGHLIWLGLLVDYLVLMAVLG